MQAACCAAKVAACSVCASTSTTVMPPNAAMAPKRSTDAAAAMTSHAVALQRANQRPCVQKKTISAPTDTAHNKPTAVLP
jgi:hypothetical protein